MDCTSVSVAIFSAEKESFFGSMTLQSAVMQMSFPEMSLLREFLRNSNTFIDRITVVFQLHAVGYLSYRVL